MSFQFMNNHIRHVSLCAQNVASLVPRAVVIPDTGEVFFAQHLITGIFIIASR